MKESKEQKFKIICIKSPKWLSFFLRKLKKGEIDNIKED